MAASSPPDFVLLQIPKVPGPNLPEWKIKENNDAPVNTYDNVIAYFLLRLKSALRKYHESPRAKEPWPEFMMQFRFELDIALAQMTIGRMEGELVETPGFLRILASNRKCFLNNAILQMSPEFHAALYSDLPDPVYSPEMPFVHHAPEYDFSWWETLDSDPFTTFSGLDAAQIAIGMGNHYVRVKNILQQGPSPGPNSGQTQSLSAPVIPSSAPECGSCRKWEAYAKHFQDAFLELNGQLKMLTAGKREEADRLKSEIQAGQVARMLMANLGRPPTSKEMEQYSQFLLKPGTSLMFTHGTPAFMRDSFPDIVKEEDDEGGSFAEYTDDGHGEEDTRPSPDTSMDNSRPNPEKEAISISSTEDSTEIAAGNNTPIEISDDESNTPGEQPAAYLMDLKRRMVAAKKAKAALGGAESSPDSGEGEGDETDGSADELFLRLKARKQQLETGGSEGKRH